MLVFACISPHPPIILPNVGSPEDRKKVKLTIAALESLAPNLAATKPDVIIISSPHPDWGTNVPISFLLSEVKKQVMIKNTQGVLPGPPLRWDSLDTSGKITVVPYLTDLSSPQVHFVKGKELIKNLKHIKKLAWIASGDMSHCLKEDGPYGFNPAGPKFDKKFIELLEKKDIRGILNLDLELIEEAGECGLRSFCMLLGALEDSGVDWEPKILSYEGPFGVGYLVAEMKIVQNSNRKNDQYLSLAKEAIESYLKTGKIIAPQADLPKSIMARKAGVFISIHTKSGELRGCIGTFLPTKENIAEEIISNAVAAATSDPRFPPVSQDELSNLVYFVDVLSSPKNVSELVDIDTKKYGLIVSTSDGRRGLLLPDIPGIETPEEQFRICCLKAGISPQEKVILQTFTVERHAENHI